MVHTVDDATLEKERTVPLLMSTLLTSTELISTGREVVWALEVLGHGESCFPGVATSWLWNGRSPVGHPRGHAFEFGRVAQGKEVHVP